MVIENLVETHCHILPEIDDGAKNVETSIKMIKKLQLQGAKAIIATPHYYSDSISLADFIAKRNASFEKLKAALPADSPKIILGAEVYISRYLFGNEDLAAMCIEGTKYALIEHPFSESFTDKAYNRLLSISCDFGITPILAHIERYKALMDDAKKLDALLDMGCLAQVNINSFADSPRSVKKRLFKYLDSGRIQLISSDCHNMDSRPPEYAKGAKEIIKKCGQSAFNRLIMNSNKVIDSI